MAVLELTIIDDLNLNIKQLIWSLIIYSLSSCSSYTKEDGKVYLRESNEAQFGVKNYKVKGADYESFEVINNDLGIDLAKDKNHVFISIFILKHADPNSFRSIKEYYWRDHKHVFLLGTKQDCMIEDADPNSFKVLLDNYWAVDHKNVFHEFNKLHGANSEAFTPINKHWGKDNQYYFYHQFRLDSLDYESAQIVISNYPHNPPFISEYIKDKTKVYFRNRLVKGADPLTFKAVGVGSAGYDSKYMYDWKKNMGTISSDFRRRYIDPN